MSGWMNYTQRMDEWISEGMGGWMNWINEWFYGLLNECVMY